jgi:glycosyltransferase involved in cell wall biosynthesis
MEYRVTAIIPVFNGAALIRRSIESVLSQTRPADEVIVVDDGSTDETANIVRSYGLRVRYLRQPNSGVAAARNNGVKQAKSEWIAFLDHDDEWLPNKLERQMALLEHHPTAALCYSAYWLHTLDGPKLLAHLPLRNLWPAARLRNPFPPSVAILRRAEFLQIGGFNETYKGASCEDWELFVRFLTAYSAVELAEPLANYYEVATGGSRNYRRMLPNTLSIVEHPLLSGLSGAKRTWWRRRIKSVLYYRAAVSARENGDSATKYLLQSFAQWPFPDFAPERFKTFAIQLLRRRQAVRST